MLIIFSTPVTDGVVGCIDQIKKTVEIDDQTERAKRSGPHNQSSKEQVGYEQASDTSGARLCRAPKGARTACRGTQKIIKPIFGFKKKSANFCLRLIFGCPV